MELNKKTERVTTHRGCNSHRLQIMIYTMAIIRIFDDTVLSEEEKRRIQYSDVMRGVGYNIGHSDKIPEDEKESLIRACENYFFADGLFTTWQRSLLYRIRNDYHIQWLANEAKPESFWDKIINYR